MRILVIGSSGMLGSAVLRVLCELRAWQVFGTIRNENSRQFFSETIRANLIANIDVEHQDTLVKLFSQIRPDVVVNCAGVIKHRSDSEDPLVAIPLNALLPHRLANLCQLIGSRLVHVSTDCVFSGNKGSYTETDFPDACDVYGKSKALGEVIYPNTVTLRTSIIGHELQGNQSLLNWFLSQAGTCRGFRRAIFSGLPTVVFSRIIRDVVIPNTNLTGLYHVASKPISKFDLLNLISNAYEKSISIDADDTLVIDRSLDATRFKLATGYCAPEWFDLVQSMHAYG